MFTVCFGASTNSHQLELAKLLHGFEINEYLFVVSRKSKASVMKCLRGYGNTLLVKRTLNRDVYMCLL